MPAPNTPLQPNDIDATKHFYGAFGTNETEVSAGWIVRFCQQRGRGWESFPLAELEAFYAQKCKDGFTFNRLTTGGYVTVRDGIVTLTTRFGRPVLCRIASQLVRAHAGCRTVVYDLERRPTVRPADPEKQ